MKFSALQKVYFGADSGAYSLVTLDERKKSQITITDADGESNIVISAIGAASIPRAAAKAMRTRLNLWEVPQNPSLSNLPSTSPKRPKTNSVFTEMHQTGLATRKGMYGSFLPAMGNFTLGACLKRIGAKSGGLMKEIRYTRAVSTSLKSFRRSWRLS
jgi:hypothetical protein